MMTTAVKKNIKLEAQVKRAPVKKKSSNAKTPTKKKPIRRKKRSSKKAGGWKWRLFKWACLLALMGFLVLFGYVFYCYVSMPDIQKAVNRTREPSTVIMAQNGNDIAKFGNVYARVIAPDRLPENLTAAVVATEDRRFYQHFGFDVWGFGRAMATNIFHRRYAQGASTITQQVAKNIFLTQGKTIKRKVQELLLAFWLENKLSKNQIMALYLNRVYFGSGLYGADAAANWYFNKSVYDLNVREAAVLAGLLKAPSRYNPILNKKAALSRADVVLKSMRDSGYLSQREYQNARALPISDGQKYRVEGGRHFAQYVYDEVNAFIGERADDIVVSTTLDQKLQETAEKILREKIAGAKGQNVSEGAVVILDKNGAVKAMVGGVDYNRSQFNRAVQAKRQSGSGFKPFVYLTALQYGFKPNSMINDAPITIGKWHPENYTKKYYGNVSLSFALAHSLNAATVALSKELYLKDIAANAKKMGISTKLEITPAMVLGTNSVRVLDMATAYAVLAGGGKMVRPYAINEISTRDGRQIYVRQKGTDAQVLAPSVARDMTIMLEAVINQGTGKRAKLPIFAAGKTGTTQNYRDAWFIGWTNKYVAAVWVGNDNEKPMNKVGGGNLPAEIWHDIMMTTLNDTPAGRGYDLNEADLQDSSAIDDIGQLIDKEERQNDAIGDLIEQNQENDSIGDLIEKLP